MKSSDISVILIGDIPFTIDTIGLAFSIWNHGTKTLYYNTSNANLSKVFFLYCKVTFKNATRAKYVIGTP